jgi:hypothetical protein
VLPTTVRLHLLHAQQCLYRRKLTASFLMPFPSCILERTYYTFPFLFPHVPPGGTHTPPPQNLG